MSYQNLSDDTPPPYSLDYPPPDFIDPVIEVYKQYVDRTIIRENLKLTIEERLLKHQNSQLFFEALRRAGRQVSGTIITGKWGNIANFVELLPVLDRHRVEFILIGGTAGVVHGSQRVSTDVDVVYSRCANNVVRLEEALKSHHPCLRGAPPGLPFRWDVPTILAGLNFTLTTDLGDIFLGEVAGGGSYEQLLPFTIELTAFGVTCRCVTLDRLIQLKRAAGRPKDLEVIAELQAILDERNRASQP